MADSQKELNTVENQTAFFPVTDYLLGQIFELKKSGINPLQYTSVDGHTDSAWIKTENVETVFKAFLEPRIDSSNLVKFFSEKSFLDRTVNAFTFTYDPKIPLPDSISWSHWDVYIDPETNAVKRIYLIKEINKNTSQQLTWVSNERAQIVTIKTDDSGQSVVVGEEKIIWDF